MFGIKFKKINFQARIEDVKQGKYIFQVMPTLLEL